jgi:hypothetical protein
MSNNISINMNDEVSNEAPVSAGDPEPSWSVPKVSLPDLMGRLAEYEQEWWYYAGTFSDDTGRVYSCMFTVSRVTQDWPHCIAGIVGLGWQETTQDGRVENHYISSATFGLGVSDVDVLASFFMLPVTDDSYNFVYRPLLSLVGLEPNIHLNVEGDNHSVEMTSGMTAAKDAKYTLKLQGKGYKTVTDAAGKTTQRVSETSFNLALNLLDERGVIMENSSGYVGPSPEIPGAEYASYECAQPRLKVNTGTLRIGGKRKGHKITEGMMWLDRQMLSPNEQVEPTKKIQDIKDLEAMITDAPPHPRPLYVGDWMGFTLKNGLSMVLVNFWQDKKKDQWITGTKVGEPPLSGFGNIYYPELRSEQIGNGGRRMRRKKSAQQPDQDWDYDVNLLDPAKPKKSPHWKSPQTGIVYATAWQIDFSPHMQKEAQLPPSLYVYAVCDSCEVVTMTPFYEGAAIVYADPEKNEHLGQAFIEQMGFTP